MAMVDRVAVVTGATGGLGRVVVRRLAEQGARLALVGTNLERLKALATDLNLPDDRVLLHEADLRGADAASSLAEAVVARFGQADILLHLVGGWAGGTPVVDLAADELGAMLQQHAWTTLYMLQAFVPHFQAQDWGRALVISSPVASHPPVKMAPYAMAKAAQEALILSQAQELRGTGVTANAIVVRSIDVAHKRDTDDSGKYASWTTPEEIASMIVYLCSDEAGMVNGARLPMYGRP